MAAGRAERIHREFGYAVSIRDAKERPRELHPAWLGNPAIDQTAKMSIVDAPGARPYIYRWEHNGKRRAIFNRSYRAEAGHLYLTESERQFAETLELPERFAVIEPIVMRPSSPNKDWGFARWAEVARLLEIPVVQFGPRDGRKVLPGVIRIFTPDFRRAAAVMEKASLILCTEGGTGHIAGALRKPAVVIFGAFTPPEMTGYDWHANIAVETPEGYCGSYDPCEHCAQAMAKITPGQVVAEARRLL